MPHSSVTSIPELSGVTPRRFREEVSPAATPVVMRGLVADWPVTRAGRTPGDLSAYLRRLDRGAPVSAMLGPPGIRGRFFYDADLGGFNFRRSDLRLSAALDLLDDYARETEPPALAIQSVPTRAALPGFEGDNPMPLVGDAVEPRAWIGNAVTVAAHHDPSENIACVVAGRRTFTLFPPDQVGNLYIGPFERTPAGTPISMVDFDRPDPERFPRFGEAMERALVAELAPGDAIYIPYLWWHHVRSTERFNMLVNYWWTPGPAGRGRPLEALMHAILAVRDLPKPHREAWKALFDHYVFEDGATAGDHLPVARHGVLGELGPAETRALKAALARGLSQP